MLIPSCVMLVAGVRAVRKFRDEEEESYSWYSFAARSKHEFSEAEMALARRHLMARTKRLAVAPIATIGAVGVLVGVTRSLFAIVL